jgi:hypothetical protein
MLSRSWLNAVVMFGFGLATLLPVMGAAGLGVPWLRSRAKPPWLQKVVGLAIFTLGIASPFRAAAIGEWCRVG